MRGVRGPARLAMPAARAGALMGLAGAIEAHFIGFIAPENHTSRLTFKVWTMLIVGGSGDNLGAIIGTGLVWAHRVWPRDRRPRSRLVRSARSHPPPPHNRRLAGDHDHSPAGVPSERRRQCPVIWTNHPASPAEGLVGRTSLTATPLPASHNSLAGRVDSPPCASLYRGRFKGRHSRSMIVFCFARLDFLWAAPGCAQQFAQQAPSR